MLIRMDKNLEVLSVRAGLRQGLVSYRRLAAMQARPGLALGPQDAWNLSFFDRGRLLLGASAYLTQSSLKEIDTSLVV